MVGIPNQRYFVVPGLGITLCPLVQLDLDLQYPCLCVNLHWPRCVRIHLRSQCHRSPRGLADSGSVPQVFIAGGFIGGADELEAYFKRD